MFGILLVLVGIQAASADVFLNEIPCEELKTVMEVKGKLDLNTCRDARFLIEHQDISAYKSKKKNQLPKAFRKELEPFLPTEQEAKIELYHAQATDNDSEIQVSPFEKAIIRWSKVQKTLYMSEKKVWLQKHAQRLSDAALKSEILSSISQIQSLNRFYVTAARKLLPGKVLFWGGEALDGFDAAQDSFNVYVSSLARNAQSVLSRKRLVEFFTNDVSNAIERVNYMIYSSSVDRRYGAQRGVDSKAWLPILYDAIQSYYDSGWPTPPCSANELSQAISELSCRQQKFEDVLSATETAILKSGG